MHCFKCWHQKLKLCESFIVDVIYNKRHDKKARYWAFVLRTFSFLFLWIVKLRTRAYKKRWLHAQHLGCTVIVVGNLTVGGTGKTPVVEKIARYLSQNGRKVAILSRGYKGKKERCWKGWMRWLTHSLPPPPKVVSDGVRCLISSEIAGDEPVLLARNLPHMPVIVDKDRVKAGQYAIRHFNADVLVLDDGFQYLQLKGSFYLLLVDATNPFGNGALLPRGILREPLSHMKRAHFIFLTKSDQVAPERLRALERFIRRYNRHAKLLPCIHCPKYLQHIDEFERLDLKMLRGIKIAVLSGIASPESFERFLKNEEAQLVYIKHFIDHHRFTEEELDQFFHNARLAGAQWVITTEKDAVRIKENFAPPLPFYFLRMEIEWCDVDHVFEQVLEKLTYDRNRKIG
ncbi:MAG: tetraacyldisaccharide 4'-kinase [Puniceicoccales bacterium]|jgi:tetraacyldisaccharide 4'-kinase|nr:tetraacyldisaccharide 4'-kinase [Puniceicoccales bacterium]